MARRLGVDWHTVWEAIKPLLEELADDPDRLAGVDTVGVDEHIWHHQPRPGKGPKEQTGIVDLTRRNGKTAGPAAGPGARPVREGLRRLAALPRERVHRRHRHRHLDPFRGYANAIRDELDDAIAVLDAFHVVRLGLQGDGREPAAGCSRNSSATAAASTTRSTGSATRCAPAPTSSPPARSNGSRPVCRPATRNFEVTVAWRCYQQLRSAFAATTLAEGRSDRAVECVESFPSCPIPEIARLGRTLAAWRQQFLAYFTTGRASNGGTEAINGIIELHRRIARGFRNPTNYRLRMILAAGKLTHPNLR